MAQIQVRDRHGRGIPGINVRIAEGQKSSDEAIFDYETDAAGNKGWPIPFWPRGEYTLHINQPDASVPNNPRFEATRVLVTAAAYDHDVVVPLADASAPVPVPGGDLTTWPRRGASIAALIVDPGWDYEEWARILGQYFRNRGLTRINIFSADWPGPTPLIWPWGRLPDGRFDLDDFNDAFVQRTRAVLAAMHGQGIVVQLTLLELYSWSNRKKGAGVPDGNLGPFRNNVNGVKWGGAYNGDRREDDATLTSLPDPWLTRFLNWFVPQIDGPGVVWEIGNEFPEKDLHYRMRDAIRAASPTALVSVNRQEDTPGQYANMKIGPDFDFAAFHGRLLKTPSDLDRLYPTEPDYQTFREFFDKCPHDPKKIIFSSDGARSSSDPIHTYDWHDLGNFFAAVLARGCSVEHQSRMKMPANVYDFSKVEHAFLQRIADT